MSKAVTKKKLNHSVSLKQFTFAQVHQSIIKKSTIAIAARHLGLSDTSTLASHLSRFILDGEILNFDSLKALSVPKAAEVFGSRYHCLFNSPVITLTNYSVLHIHHIAMHSKTIREAASKLGSRDHSLKRYLQKYTYLGEPIDFGLFKVLTKTQVEAIFADLVVPKGPEQRINLTPLVPFTYGFSEIQKSQSSPVTVCYDFDTIPELLPFSIFGSGQIIETQASSSNVDMHEVLDTETIEWLANGLEVEEQQVTLV